MRQKKSEEEIEIKEFTGLLHEYLMEQIPSEETLENTYQLSEGFFEKDGKACAKYRKAGEEEEAVAHSRGSSYAYGSSFCFRMQFFVDAAEALIWNFVDYASFQFEWNADVSHTPKYAMQYVPDGYEPVSEKYYGICGFLCYRNQKENRLCLYYMPIDVTLDIENKDREFETLKEKDGTIYYMRALKEGEESFLIWEEKDKTVKFKLEGVLSKEELLAVQKKVRKVQE